MEEKKTNTIGKDFTLSRLAKFVAAPVVSKMFIALLQTLDDSLFMSRYVGEMALAAFSIAMPWFMLVDAVSMIFCATSAKCSMLMGEKKNEEANRTFTTMVLIDFAIGCIFSLILTLFREKILRFLGATDILLPYALEYMNVSRFYTPLVFLSFMFSRFYVVAGRPKASVFVTVGNTFCNFFFDWLFIVRMKTGVVGTAYANLIGNIFNVVVAIYFFSSKEEEIHFEKPYEIKKFAPQFLEICNLGRADSLTSISLSVNSFVCNKVLLKVGSEEIVSAYTIVNNVQFMFMNSFFGLLDSVNPIISYAFGEKNPKKLSKNIRLIAVLVLIQSTIIMTAYIVFKKPVINLYLPDAAGKQHLREMINYGMKIAPMSFLIFGFNVFVMSSFNAVGNYKVSSLLSSLENIIFANLCMIVLPNVFGTDGVWFVFLAQEILTFFFSIYYASKNKDNYGYGKSGKALLLENNEN